MQKVIPDFEGWASFAKVAELRSFSAAADALGVSNGTVSKSVSRLEARLGVTLFHRTTRRLSLTPIGKLLVPRAAALLDDAEATENLARNEAAGPHGLVRVAAPLGFGIVHLVPLLPLLLDQLPGIVIDLNIHDAPTDLVANGIDVAVRIGWPADNRLKVRKLGEIRSSIVASPVYLACAGTPESLADLSKHAMLGYSNMRSYERLTLRNTDGQTKSVQVRNIFLTNSGDAMLELLRSGHAIGVMPDFMVAKDLKDGRLRRILTKWDVRVAGLYLVTPSSGPRPSRVKAVIEFLSQHLGQTGSQSTDAAASETRSTGRQSLRSRVRA